MLKLFLVPESRKLYIFNITFTLVKSRNVGKQKIILILYVDIQSAILVYMTSIFRFKVYFYTLCYFIFILCLLVFMGTVALCVYSGKKKS